jgi:Rrf2 family protein
VARRQNIPARFLDQIFQDLRRAGLVRSKRGPKGGFTLARAPEEVSLGDVLRAVEGASAFGPSPSAGKKGAAADRTLAPLVDAVFRELADGVARAFDAVTFAELIRRGEALGIARGPRGAYMYFI